MTFPFVSPGGSGTAGQVVQVPGGDLSVLKPHFHSRADLAAGRAQMFRPSVTGVLDFTATIQGYNTSVQHAAAVEAIIWPALFLIQNITGNFVASESRQAIIDFDAIDTGKTMDSIHPIMSSTGDRLMVDIGPTTFYSPLIEFGLGPHMPYGPRPFMSSGFAAVVPSWLKVLHQLSDVAAKGQRGRISTPPYSSGLNELIRKVRKQLYAREKLIGDIAPLGLPGGIGQGTRGAAILGARILGDIQAVLGRVVGGRIIRRLTGQVTGRLIGVGAHTIFGNRLVNTNFGPGQRIYNRIAGRQITKYVDQTSVIRGLGRG